MVHGIIYLVKNKINGKIYFGQTCLPGGFDERYSNDIEKNTHNLHLKNSIKKYGIENFLIIKNFDCAYSQDELDKLEDMYICLYNTMDQRYGYNKRRGGNGGLLSEETKKKISEKISGEGNGFYGKQHSEETKEHFRQVWSQRKLDGYKPHNFGTRMSDEQRKKVSETRKAYLMTLTEEDKKHRFGTMSGKTHNEDTKQKISETCKKSWTQERRQAHSEALTGRKHSAEAIEKMKNSAKNRDSEEYRKKLSETCGTKVICVTTGDVFCSFTKAAEWVNGNRCGMKRKISSCCKGQVEFAGVHPETGEKLKWNLIK